MKHSPLSYIRIVLKMALSAVFLVACTGGDGTGLPPAGPLGPNFSQIQANVFSTTCATTGCHFGAGAPLGLRLDDANSYALLVGVASAENSSVLRVAPGNPNLSYLIQKLEGTASSGEQMPLNAPALAQATIDVIRQWITDGAIDDRLIASNPLRVTSLSPLPDSTLNTGPTEIIAIFDRPPDASTVNLNTFLLVASGGDMTFGDGNETAVVAASISVPLVNPQTAIFDLNSMELPDDTYQIRLLGDGASLILDLDANALDGEFSGAFPSGDGIQDGDFAATFTIMSPAIVGGRMPLGSPNPLDPALITDIRQWIADGAAP